MSTHEPARPETTTTGTGTAAVTPADIAWAVVRGNWLGAGAVAVATAFTAGLLGLGLALLAKPVDFGLSNTLALATTIATGAFGADLQLEVGSDPEVTFVAVDGTAALGVFPLTVTLLSLLVGALVFRRATRGYPSRLVALGDAARAALLFGVCLAVPALVFTADNDELGRGWGREVSRDASGYDLEISASALGAFGLGFLLLLATLAVVTCVRRLDRAVPDVAYDDAGVATRRTDLLRGLLRPVAAGLATLLACLPVAGAIGVLATVPGGDDSSEELTSEGTRTAVAFLLGGIANGGSWLLSLGAGAPVGGTASATGIPTERGHSRLWGEVTESEPGLWIAPVVLVGVLALATYVVLRVARRDLALPALGAWLLTLLVAVPWLVRVSSVRFGASLEAGVGEDEERYRIDAVAGPDGVQTTLLVLLVALVVAVALAFLTGRADPDRLT